MQEKQIEQNFYSKKHWALEYRIATDNWHHGDDLRESIMRYWITFTTVLIVALGALFRQDYSKLIWFPYAIGLLGIMVSISALLMEIRENMYTDHYFKRCQDLERYESFQGQYISVENIRNSRFNRRNIMKGLYVFGIVFWLVTTFYAVNTPYIPTEIESNNGQVSSEYKPSSYSKKPSLKNQHPLGADGGNIAD